MAPGVGNTSRILLLTLAALGAAVFLNLKSSLVFSSHIITATSYDFPVVIPKDWISPVVPHCRSLCDCLRQKALEENVAIPSVVSLWRRYSSKILDASFRLEDVQNKTLEYQAWVQHLFAWTTTSRLVKSFETFPQDIDSLKSLHAIVQERFEKGDSAPPLKVAVFGGSLTAGHGCLENPLGMPTQSFLKRQLPCAWPARLQTLLDTFAPGLVNITNMAMAATTSDVGATVIDYQLWPVELLPDGPDVVIAAFATNDALAEAPETEIYQNMQLLVESIHRERNCKKSKLPLLIYVDDFIAWPGSVQKYLDFHHDLHELADWHGFGYISYANAFREIVHADLMQENTFKGPWTTEKRGKYVANPHPGLSFHIVMSWVMVFNLLNLSFHVCDGSLEELAPIENKKFPMVSIPSIQRPPLDPGLLTQSIPKAWKQLEIGETQRCSTVSSGPRCGFVWIANRVSDFRTAPAIEVFLNKYLTFNDGWKAEGNSYRSKHGWVAKKEKARFKLAIRSLETSVRYITILSLKSYGNEWKHSRLSVQVIGKEFLIDGVHDSGTSVILPHKFDLGEVIPEGSSINVVFDLVGGVNFKITGMAFCAQ